MATMVLSSDHYICLGFRIYDGLGRVIEGVLLFQTMVRFASHFPGSFEPTMTTEHGHGPRSMGTDHGPRAWTTDHEVGPRTMEHEDGPRTTDHGLRSHMGCPCPCSCPCPPEDPATGASCGYQSYPHPSSYSVPAPCSCCACVRTKQVLPSSSLCSRSQLGRWRREGGESHSRRICSGHLHLR